MATWLYLASASKSSLDKTYRYLEQGFLWRSYFIDTQHRQAVANAKHLAVGDTLYVGYRTEGKVTLLGRCTLASSETPINESPVFCVAPKELEEDLKADGCTNDPALGKIVGIFVSEIEPLSDTMDLPRGAEHNSIVRWDDSERVLVSSSSTPSRSLRQQVAARSRVSEGSSGGDVDPNRGSELYVGVDVAGRPEKGFTLCFLSFSQGRLENISFDSLPYEADYKMPATQDLRGLVASGALDQVANVTCAAAIALSTVFQERVVSRNPKGVFIDAPSAFSRNCLGHGRATEKVAYRGVSFQCTPSVACGREHRGDWNWLLYGMAAFFALRTEARNAALWKESLATGMYPVFTQARNGCRVRECFPTATVSVLREDQEAIAAVVQMLEEFRHGDVAEEVNAVCQYLGQGVRAVKTRQPLYDRADSLVAALLSLPQVLPGTFRESERLPRDTARWDGADNDLEREGRIAVVERQGR